MRGPAMRTAVIEQNDQKLGRVGRAEHGKVVRCECKLAVQNRNRPIRARPRVGILSRGRRAVRRANGTRPAFVPGPSRPQAPARFPLPPRNPFGNGALENTSPAMSRPRPCSARHQGQIARIRNNLQAHEPHGRAEQQPTERAQNEPSPPNPRRRSGKSQPHSRQQQGRINGNRRCAHRDADDLRPAAGEHFIATRAMPAAGRQAAGKARPRADTRPRRRPAGPTGPATNTSIASATPAS